MDFEEMKVIWDSQNREPVYALDRRALYAAVKRKADRVERSLNLFEALMMVILPAVAVILVVKRVVQEPDYPNYLLIGGALTMAVALGAVVHLALGRVRRRKREAEFPASLLGDLDRAISQIDYQVSRLKTFHFWFVLPMAAMIITNAVMKGAAFSQLLQSPKIWVWPMFLLAIGLSYAAIELEMRRFHRPRKRNLEALREKLLAER